MNKKKKNYRLLRKFLVTFFLTFIGLVAVGLVVLYSYAKSQLSGASEDPEVAKVAAEIGSSLHTPPKNPAAAFAQVFDSLPKRVNFIIYGIDGNGEEISRTDTMILGCFNTQKSTIDLVSVPRDIQVLMPAERRAILQDKGQWIPSDGLMKLNAVYFYAGKTYGPTFATKQIEELLGVKIDYYAAVNLKAFRYIVDQVGGVEFDVPYKFDYEDEDQDLYIHLRPGLQVLNGSDAEGLVRFRDHDNTLRGIYTDWDRGETQQKFIGSLVSQVLSKGTSAGDLMAIAGIALENVNTNFDISNLPKFYKAIQGLSADNIHTHKLIGDDIKDGQYYTILDMDKSMEIINSIFYDDGAETAQDAVDPANLSSLGKKIQILNGGFVTGLAGQTRDALKEQGFTVSSVGDFFGEKQAATRILVSKNGMGQDLTPLFKNTAVAVDAVQCREAGADIIIILGTDEE